MAQGYTVARIEIENYRETTMAKKIVMSKAEFDSMTWKPVKGYNTVLVSDTGIVVDVWTHRIYQPIISNAGYQLIHIGNRVMSVARIVCEAFFGTPAKGMEVDHIDGNRLNNNLWNLRWVSRSVNLSNRHSKNPRRRNRKVRCVETGEIYRSARSAGNAVGVSCRMILFVLDGKAKSAGNYHWEEV